jgi:hypothetical protein
MKDFLVKNSEQPLESGHKKALWQFAQRAFLNIKSKTAVNLRTTLWSRWWLS